MGRFDTIFVEMPLPENAPEFLKKCPDFQTYDLSGDMADYIITKEGELQLTRSLTSGILLKAFGLDENTKIPPLPIPYKRKKLTLYASNCRGSGKVNGEYTPFTENGEDMIDITYVVQIRNSKVSSIKETGRTVKPAHKMRMPS